jgi:hypothetical protein
MWIMRFDSLDQFASLGVTGHNGVRTALTLLPSVLSQVESKTRLSHLGIRTMAAEAASGEDWLDILVEIQ